MLTFFDGFENYSNSADIAWNWTSHTINSVPQISLSGGFSNSRAIALIGPNNQSSFANNWWLNKNIEFSTTVSIGMAIRYSPVSPSNNNINPIFHLMYDNDTNICVYLKYVIGGGFIPIFTKILSNNTNDAIAVGNLLRTGFKLSDWHYYELELDCSINGSARFYVDGNMVLELTNYNFSAGSNELTNRFRTYAGIWQGVSTSISTTTIFDDFYITNNNARIGQVRIQAIRPSADTVQKEWTPSTGTTNFGIVNKIGLSSGTYVSAISQDATDLYQVGNLADSNKIEKIVGLKATSYSDKNMFGNTSSNIILTSNSTTINLPKNELYEQRIVLNDSILELNPTTDLPWTIEDVDNIQIGVTTHIETNILGAMVSGNFYNGDPISLLVNGDTPPTKNGDLLIFNGSQVIRYGNAPSFHVTPPWSIVFDCYFGELNSIGKSMIMFSIGKGVGNAYELGIGLSEDNNIFFVTSDQDDIGSEHITIILPDTLVKTRTWYRIGLMVYDDSGLKIRSYVDGVQRTDNLLSQPWNSTAGLAIGNNNNVLTTTAFSGRIKNLRIGKSLFWKI